MFDFIEKYYLWFLIVAVVLVLALIGYFVDVKKESEDSPFKKKKTKAPKEVAPNTSNANMENVAINSNMSLNEMINNTNGAVRVNENPNPENNDNNTEAL